MIGERGDDSDARRGAPLVVRGSLPRTFFSMGVFVEGLLLFCGAYLLNEMARRPLETTNVAILVAGTLLALAVMLLLFLLQPLRKEGLSRRDGLPVEDAWPKQVLTEFGESLKAKQRATAAMEDDDLPGPM